MTTLATVDGEAGSARVAEVAYDLAAAYDDDLVVLHVMSNEEFADRQDSNPGLHFEQAEESAQRAAKRVVRESGHEPGDVETRGAVGDVAETVLDAVTELDARYLVIGGRKRSPIGKALFGSTTQTLLLDAGCPVVTVLEDE